MISKNLKKHFDQSKKFAGFSLIELLVTISVIAVLLTILIPVIGVVRDSAKKTKSLSNLRQIASAMKMYSSDHDGLYPIGYREPPEGTPGYAIYWYLEIAPYLNHETISKDESNNVLISPFLEREIATIGHIDGGAVRNSPCTYSVHGLICSSVDRFPVWNIKENHSEIILVGEGTQNQWGFADATFRNPAEWQNAPTTPFTNAQLENTIPTYSEFQRGVLSYRANNHTLVAFLDGHVGALEKGTVQYKNIVINP